MNKIIAPFLAILTALVFILTGCSSVETSIPNTGIPTTTVPKTTTPTTSTLPIIVTPTATVPASIVDFAAVDKLVIDFVKNSTTFKFDGIANSLSLVRSEASPISSWRALEYTMKYQTAHPGHGDRSRLMLAQVITEHVARIYYDQDQNIIRMAGCDATWDLLKDKELPKSISGIVVSGGDTAQPDGPLDVPHTFIYQVRQDDGTIINVSYKGYPPSPAGDAARAKIFLEFHAGTILIGDKIYATGMLDKSTNTIVIGEEGGYIRTEIAKMQVIGKVISGGDTTPKGLLDAPRKFVYSVQKDDGSTINIAYTVYPPSPAGDINNAKITLSFYAGEIQVGDHLMAYGNYDLATNTILVRETGDLVKTYPVKPN
jgi:hypothetical protein